MPTSPPRVPSGPADPTLGVTAEVRAVANEIARLDVAVFKRFYAGRRQVAGEVTPRMVTVLRHLAVTGPLTVGEQAQHLGLSPASMTELVDRLEQRHLVERMRDDADRRRVFIWLTERGRQHLDGLPAPEDPLVQAVAAMDPADRRHLVEGLRALLAVPRHPSADPDQTIDPDPDQTIDPEQTTDHVHETGDQP